MDFILKISVFISLIFTFSEASDTTCEESAKHFANLCFSPEPTLNVDVKWTFEAQPADGWHVEMTNDVLRLHYAELLYGKLLTLQDNFDDSCFTSRLDHGDGVKSVIDGTNYGFGNLTYKWDCNASMDFPGVLKCDHSSSGLSKYHENVNVYPTYSDNKNLQILVQCFPNGQVGWMALSITKTLTEKERKTVSDHVKSIGFSDDNTVITYTEKCSNES